MMDSFLIMCLHSRTFCLERREGRVGQFKSEVTRVEGTDHRFVHNFAMLGMRKLGIHKHVPLSFENLKTIAQKVQPQRFTSQQFQTSLQQHT